MGTHQYRDRRGEELPSRPCRKRTAVAAQTPPTPRSAPPGAPPPTHPPTRPPTQHTIVGDNGLDVLNLRRPRNVPPDGRKAWRPRRGAHGERLRGRVGMVRGARRGRGRRDKGSAGGRQLMPEAAPSANKQVVVTLQGSVVGRGVCGLVTGAEGRGDGGKTAACWHRGRRREAEAQAEGVLPPSPAMHQAARLRLCSGCCTIPNIQPPTMIRMENSPFSSPESALLYETIRPVQTA